MCVYVRFWTCLCGCVCVLTCLYPKIFFLVTWTIYITWSPCGSCLYLFDLVSCKSEFTHSSRDMTGVYVLDNAAVVFICLHWTFATFIIKGNIKILTISRSIAYKTHSKINHSFSHCLIIFLVTVRLTNMCKSWKRMFTHMT